MEKLKLTRMAFVGSYTAHTNSYATPPSPSSSKREIKRTEMVQATLAPRELTDSEVDAMWAKYPGLRFEDFFPAGECA